MYHITGKIYGLELNKESKKESLMISVLISVDKSLVKKINKKYFVPFVFNTANAEAGRFEVSKREKEYNLTVQEEKYSLTVKLDKVLCSLLSESSVIGKTASIIFNETIKSTSGPEINESSIEKFIITE